MTEKKENNLSTFVMEIPSSLKQLARMIVRGFYQIEDSLIVDMLVRYPCMREDDLCELLKFDKKMIRAKISVLRMDKILSVKHRIETGEDGKVVKMNCYFINFKSFVNLIKYRLDHMRKKMETSERDATSRSSFKCGGCCKTFTDLEANQLFDAFTGEFRCTYCSGPVDEDESAGPKNSTRQQLARFNEQIAKVYELLRNVENIRLAPHVLDPEPVEFKFDSKGVLIGIDRKRQATYVKSDSAQIEGRWADSSVGSGFRLNEQNVNVTFGENKEVNGSALSNIEERKEVPAWITGGVVNKQVVPSCEDENIDEDVEIKTDEITSLLLRHEKRGGDLTYSKKPIIPGASDSDKSDDSIDEDSNQLATFPTNSNVSPESDDEDGGDLPCVQVGDEEFAVTDITEDIIQRMTVAEKEQYTHVFQEFYADMYD